MINVMELDDKILAKIFKNRDRQADTLWDIVKKDYKKNKSIWKNEPAWMQTVNTRRSKTRDNRVFLAQESQTNKITARPVKPMVIPANETEEAKEVAENLQKVFLEDYRNRNVKKHMKRGIRYLHFSRLFCLKVFWNNEIDNYDVRTVDSRKVKFSANSTNEAESEFSIEKIDDKTVLDMLELFPDEEKEILSTLQITKEKAITENQKVEYFEMWIGDGVFWMLRNDVIKKILNPYWDFKGLLLTPEEKAEIDATQDTTQGEALLVNNGRRRRQMFAKFKGFQKERRENSEDSTEVSDKYETYLYNHFDKPRAPYIFGTILEVEDRPIGETTMIAMVNPLQEDVDKSKRQISDNAETLNGITKFDTDIVTMTLAEARAAHFDPMGILFGPGVSSGVTRETGQALPDTVFKNLQDSRNEIDEIYGTGSTFRGSGSDKERTATGRAILREEGLSRLDEMVDLVDFVGYELYNWWFQLIKVKYTESHLTKVLGSKKAARTIDIMQDDLQDGIEIRITPGQTLPDDKLFRAERAREDAKDGLIDTITYLEMAGGYDNPEEIVRRSILFKANPFNLIKLDGEDLDMIEEGHRILTIVQGQQGGVEGGGQDPQQIAQLREQAQKVLESEEFKALPDDQKEIALNQIREQFQRVGGVEFNRELA